MNRTSLHKTISKTVLALVLMLCFGTAGTAQWETVYNNINNNLPDLEAVEFTTPEYGLATSNDGEIMRTQNGGRNWEKVGEFTDFDFQDIQFLNSTTVFVVGRTNGGFCNTGVIEGLIARSYNYGATWDTTEVEFGLNAIHFVNEAVGYAVGHCGAFYRTINGGQDWTLEATDTDENLRTVHFINDQTGFIAGDDDAFFKTDNQGDTWTNEDLNDAVSYRQLYFTSNTGYLLSDNKLHRTTNDGIDWEEVDHPTNLTNTTLFFVDDMTGYFAGSFAGSIGSLFKTTNGGEDWGQEASSSGFGATGLTVRDLFFLDADIGFVVGHGQLNKTLNGGGALTDIQFVSGNIIHDVNDNCTLDNGEPGLEGWLIEADNGTDRIYTTSTDLGNYFMALETGTTYDIRAIAPNTNWDVACGNSSYTLNDPFDTLELNIAVKTAIVCPLLSVDVSTHMLTHCADNEYRIRYCNEGTATAVEPYVVLTLHEDLSITSSDLDYTFTAPNIYRFDLDDVAVGDCGGFEVVAFLDCNTAEEGQTHSVIAHIFPDSICETPDAGWDGSSLKIDAICEGDSVTFTVKNEGAGAMAAEDYIIIIEDVVLLQIPPIDLEPEGEERFTFYPDGKTLRLELNQHPLHPGEKKRAVSVEGCGTDVNGNISKGIVNQLPEYDGNPFISMDCQESTITSTNATKRAYPKGYGVERYTETNVDLDYHIHFQNAGTDTVYTVIVQDTLSEWLNASSIRQGSASHDFEFELYGKGIVRYTFKNIQLPPASVNEAASHGFVKFRVDQLLDNAPGTLILNKASIVFDFGNEAISNETNNLIQADFIPMLPSTNIEGLVETSIGEGVFGVEVRLTNVSEEITTDSTGGYLFGNVIPGTASEITPFKNTNILNGIDVLDVALIHKHAVGKSLLDDPYKFIAADIDHSETITTVDVFHLQKAILEIDTQFVNNESWRFVKSDYTFPNPVNPLGNPLPESFLLSNPDSDNQIHFTGIKIGDVNNTANPLSLLTTTNDTNVDEPLKLWIDDVKLQQGNYYDIPVYVNKNAELLACQFAIGFDTEALEYIDLQADAATKMRSDNFGFSFLELGVITVCWFDQNTQETTNSKVSADEKSLLFNLRFLAKKETNLSELLTLKGDFIPGRAYERKGDFEENYGKLIPKISFGLLDQNQTTDFDHSALEIFPNPVKNVLHLQYTIDSESDIEIQLVNTLGKTFKEKQIKERRQKGTYTYKMDTSDLPQGTYFIHAVAGGKPSIKKMVKLR